MEKRLKQRMYFFVPYNISPIQQAIQAGHAALEYAYKYGNTSDYIDFIINDKTWIILNGGTTNTKRDFNGISLGSLNQICDSLVENKINFMYFNEPDLQDALTAVCFLADERVWDYENYLEFEDIIDETSWDDDENYKNWLETMGGEKNLFLRDLILNKKLA